MLDSTVLLRLNFGCRKPSDQSLGYCHLSLTGQLSKCPNISVNLVNPVYFFRSSIEGMSRPLLRRLPQ